MCPSKDRSDTEENNRETFLMSNMQPQSPKLNQKTWKYLEDYTREIVGKQNEAYVYAGCYGEQGKIREKITIPTNCFKIIVVLPEGDDDMKRIDKNTRVIAVDMPNDETVSIRWRSYLTTTDAVEEKTGFDFLSGVSKKIQKEIESKKDDQSTGDDRSADPPPAKENDKTDDDDREYLLGPRGGCYYLTASGRKTYVNKKFCENLPAASDTKKPDVPTDKQTDKPTDKKEAKKNDKEKKSTKKTGSDQREYFTGSRGGCYYLTASGNKKYVDKKFCEAASPNAPNDAEDEKENKEQNEKKADEKSTDDAPANKSDGKGRTYIRGSRGGCYYLTESGRKKYVDRDLCTAP